MVIFWSRCRRREVRKYGGNFEEIIRKFLLCFSKIEIQIYLKFRKVIKKSKHYLKAAPLMDFEAEMKIRGFKVFDQNGYMIERNFRFGTISITKTY